MKIFRYVMMMAALLLGVSGVARAFTFQVLDPTGSEGSLPPINLNGPNPFSFYTCNVFPAEDGCFGAYNNSPDTITSFSATITDPNPTNPIAPLDCPTAGADGQNSAFTNAPICTLVGNTITVSFSGGPGVGPGHTIWIVESGEPASDFPADAGTFTVTSVPPVPEPSSIWMALSGTGVFGYLVRRRRRNS